MKNVLSIILHAVFVDYWPAQPCYEPDTLHVHVRNTCIFFLDKLTFNFTQLTN